jgi:hypothetical protein
MRAFILSALPAIAIAACDPGERIAHVALTIDPPLQSTPDAARPPPPAPLSVEPDTVAP